MHPYEPQAQGGRRRWRQYSNEYKVEVVASCRQRGVSSVAAVAREHDPNLLRKWIQEHERFGAPQSASVLLLRRDVAEQFIPIQLPEPEVPRMPFKADRD